MIDAESGARARRVKNRGGIRRISVWFAAVAVLTQLFPLSPANASHELVVTLIPSTEASPVGSWAAYQVYARDEAGAPYTGTFVWKTEATSAHSHSGYVTVTNGWGRFGYTGTRVGNDLVTINYYTNSASVAPAAATRAWYEANVDVASTTPARIVFDDPYYDWPADGSTRGHGFAVYNAAGERIRNSGLQWTATLAGVHGPRTFSGRLDSTGYAYFLYRAETPGWDELVVTVGQVAGSAARSYGLTSAEIGELPTLDCDPNPLGTNPCADLLVPGEFEDEVDTQLSPAEVLAGDPTFRSACEAVNTCGSDEPRCNARRRRWHWKTVMGHWSVWFQVRVVWCWDSGSIYWEQVERDYDTNCATGGCAYDVYWQGWTNSSGRTCEGSSCHLTSWQGKWCVHKWSRYGQVMRYKPQIRVTGFAGGGSSAENIGGDYDAHVACQA